MSNRISKVLLAAAVVGSGFALASCDEYYGGGVAVGYDVAWGDPYWGWYGDYYYPGTGVYVYDANRHRIPWNDAQRGYWQGRHNNWHGDMHWRNNWHEFHRRPGGH